MPRSTPKAARAAGKVVAVVVVVDAAEAAAGTFWLKAVAGGEGGEGVESDSRHESRAGSVVVSECRFCCPCGHMVSLFRRRTAVIWARAGSRARTLVVQQQSKSSRRRCSC